MAVSRATRIPAGNMWMVEGEWVHSSNSSSSSSSSSGGGSGNINHGSWQFVSHYWATSNLSRVRDKSPASNLAAPRSSSLCSSTFCSSSSYLVRLEALPVEEGAGRALAGRGAGCADPRRHGVRGAALGVLVVFASRASEAARYVAGGAVRLEAARAEVGDGGTSPQRVHAGGALLAVDTGPLDRVGVTGPASVQVRVVGAASKAVHLVDSLGAVRALAARGPIGRPRPGAVERAKPNRTNPTNKQRGTNEKRGQPMVREGKTRYVRSKKLGSNNKNKT